MMLALLLLAVVRTYHQVAVKDIPTTTWTHVCTRGVVAWVARESDGDIHVRLTDGDAFIVLETIPEWPLPRPRKGQRIDACGIVREDKAHKWHELHPLTSWSLRP